MILTSWCYNEFKIFDTIRLTQPWPDYIKSGKPTGKAHTGIDISGVGEVYAVEPGLVTEVVKGYPKVPGYVSIRGADTSTLQIYKHVKSDFKPEDVIERDQVIGVLDNSGEAAGLWAGYHLHFMIMLGMDRIDPLLYLMEYRPELKYQLSKNSGIETYLKNKAYWPELESRISKF